MLPIAHQGQKGVAGIFVAALNPFRPVDDAYRSFVDLFVGQIAAGLANAHAYEAERRRAQALAEIDRAKTAFFSNVSHEFRTPLTLLLGPLDDARRAEGAVPREILDQLDVAHRNGQRLLKLVNTLLDFSRIEAGRVRARFAPVDLVRADDRSREHLPIRHGQGGTRVRRRVRAPAGACLRRSRDVGEDRPEPHLQRVQVHTRRPGHRRPVEAG